MKICPTCNRQYPDNAVPFCAGDGTPLIETPTAPAQPPANFFGGAPQQQPSNFSSQPVPVPEYSLPYQNPAGGNFGHKPRSGVGATVLGALAVLVSLGGLLLVLVLGGAGLDISDSTGKNIVFVIALIGLTLGLIAVVLGFQAGKGRIVAFLGVLSSLVPIGLLLILLGVFDPLYNWFYSDSSENSTYATSSKNTAASNTPGDTMRALVRASERSDIAAFKQNISSSSLALWEKEAAKNNTTLDQVLLYKVMNPIKAELNRGGRLQFRNEIITGNKATVENTIDGTIWKRATLIIEDGQWKLT